jgi:hypothetical protein
MKAFGVLIIALLLGCNTSKKHVNGAPVLRNENSKISVVDYSAGPSTIIYKTKKDYYDKIPVTLNEGKTKIVSYPAPTDIYYNGQLAYPTKLNNGYLLDNRGISKNVAFLNITYEEFSKVNEVPPLSEMMNMIIDKEPFTEMYNCGNRYQYKDVVNDLNKAIDNNQLYKFKRIL